MQTMVALLQPALRQGLFNPMTSAIPLRLRSHKVPAGDGEFWCAWPRLNEVNGNTVFILYRAILEDAMQVRPILARA